MEGLSYWIFLAAFYLLSAFMKKRRQQVSDSDTSTEKKPSIFQNQFFQDLFQDMKEVNVESEDSFLEKFDNLDEREILEEENNKTLEEEVVISEDLSKFSDVEKDKKIKRLSSYDIKNQLQVSFFKNIDDLKRGIIIKEILDKPRALRKNIF
tara:strand:- start:42 stop:497 length:456 start_codon:yes stop_codon:yes gene_type:complete